MNWPPPSCLSDLVRSFEAQKNRKHFLLPLSGRLAFGGSLRTEQQAKKKLIILGRNQKPRNSSKHLPPKAKKSKKITHFFAKPAPFGAAPAPQLAHSELAGCVWALKGPPCCARMRPQPRRRRNAAKREPSGSFLAEVRWVLLETRLFLVVFGGFGGTTLRCFLG